MPRLRTHHKVWLVGATFTVAGLVAALLLSAQIRGAQTDLAGIRTRTVVQSEQLSEVASGLARGRAAFTDAVLSPDPSRRVVDLQSALDATTTAKTQWAAFTTTGSTLPGERAKRARIDAAFAAADDLGRSAGVAIIGAPPGAPVPVTSDITGDLAATDAASTAVGELRGLVADDGATRLTRAEQHRDDIRRLGLILVAIAIALGLAVMIVVARSVQLQERELEEKERDRRETEHRNELDAQLGRALEMVTKERQAFEIIEQSLREVAGTPAEVLLADSSRAHFERVVATESDAPGCAVEGPAACPAARRAVTLLFPDRTALDACPYLREMDGPCGAVCLPVTVGNQALGVVHVSTPSPEGLDAAVLVELELVARKAGERVGMLRAFAASEAQARTDPLTGLLNRRSLENRIRDLGADDTGYVVAFGDLDRFKDLNDTHGHETGDRALRLFSRVLMESVRPDDVTARYGGEEFVVVLPDCGTDAAVAILERVRENLALALAGGTLPPFTVSFGLAPSAVGRPFDEVVATADAALLLAKRRGRNRVVVAPDPGGSLETTPVRTS